MSLSSLSNTLFIIFWKYSLTSVLFTNFVNNNSFFTKKGNQNTIKQTYARTNKYRTNDNNNHNTQTYGKRVWNDNQTSNNNNNNTTNNENNNDLNIQKPIYYNSKKIDVNNPLLPIQVNKTLFVQNIINLNQINETIKSLQLSQMQLYKDSTKKELEKEYGALNINAKNYIPKKKLI